MKEDNNKVTDENFQFDENEKNFLKGLLEYWEEMMADSVSYDESIGYTAGVKWAKNELYNTHKVMEKFGFEAEFPEIGSPD